MTRCAQPKNSFVAGLSTLIIWAVACGFIQSQAWEKRSAGIYEGRVNTIRVHPVQNTVIFAGTEKALYISEDNGRSYQAVSGGYTDLRHINRIYADSAHPELILVATDYGLFESRNQGDTWNKIFHAADADTRVCRDVIIFHDRIYLATLSGLYTRPFDSAVWVQEKQVFGSKPVYFLAQDEQHLYAVTGSDLYRLDGMTKQISEIFSLPDSEINDIGSSEESDNADEDSYQTESAIKAMAVGTAPAQELYLAAENNIFISINRGETWEKLRLTAIPGDIRSLIAIQASHDSHGTGATGRESVSHPGPGSDILIGTDKGVYQYRQGDWVPLYQGMETGKVNDLLADAQGGLYAATDAGLFFRTVGKALSLFNDPGLDYHKILKDFSHEPTIRDVQKIAVDYAEVNPSKISQWRSEARRRAWLPSLSVGLDGDRNITLGDSVWGSYSSGGQLFIGPDDKTFYNNFGWDVSLSWDLADLVWSSDQTSIDSRSKLMVELREDILDEITRLYFERRRLQIELAAQACPDTQTLFDKNMRIDELTALIDALTGGEFSRRIQNGLGAVDGLKNAHMINGISND